MSAGGVLRYTIVVRHPDTTAATPLLAGEPVPKWASGLVHADDMEPVKGKPSDGPPPKAGKSSGREAWAAYADDQGVEHDDDATRDDLIAAVEAAGVPTE